MKAIAAMSKNRVIGLMGKLPWHISGDLKFFKKMTQGQICVVGRKTYEGLPPLRNRKFVVVTKDVTYPLKDNMVATWHDINLVPSVNQTEPLWLIGGAEMYRQYLPVCTDLYLTRILKDYEGDTMFPSFDHLFIYKETLESNQDYMIVHYKRREDI